jgi:hypothetical protein
LALVALVISSLVLPYTSHLYSCESCRRSWIARDRRPYPVWVLALWGLLAGSSFYAVFAGAALVFGWKGPWAP